MIADKGLDNIWQSNLHEFSLGFFNPCFRGLESKSATMKYRF